MGALKIDCHCDEVQMENIIGLVVTHINQADLNDVRNIDNIVDDVRVCVNFESYLDIVHLIESEILDSNWELLYEDTAVFTSRLKKYLNDFNARNKELVKQSLNIREE